VHVRVLCACAVCGAQRRRWLALALAPARASASHRRRRAAPCMCAYCVRVLCAGRGMCWRHADETEAPVFVTTTKKTPLLQHPAHSAAASWGVARLTAPCPGTQPVALCASAPPPTVQRTTFLRPSAPWRACRKMLTPRRPGPRRRRRATTSWRTCSPGPPGLSRCHARAAGQRYEPGLPCRPHGRVSVVCRLTASHVCACGACCGPGGGRRACSLLACACSRKCVCRSATGCGVCGLGRIRRRAAVRCQLWRPSRQ